MFSWQKKEVSRHDHEKEKYRFMKEQMRPNRKLQILQSGKYILWIIFCALLFGVIAASTFYLIQSRMMDKLDEEQKTTVQTYSRGQGASIRQDILSHNGDGDLKLDDYNTLTKTLAEIGKSYENSLVTVYWQDDNYKMGSLGKAQDSNISGLIFKESTDKYYILAMTDDRRTKTEASVRFSTGRHVKAALLAVDSVLGMFVLTVDKKDVSGETRNQVDVINLAERQTGISYGSTVIMAGSPAGGRDTVLFGNVIKADSELYIEDNCITLYTTDIQKQEGANGIVLNTEGKVVGMIACQKLTSQESYGLAFVEMAQIQRDVVVLESGREPARLGIEGISLEDGDSQTPDGRKGIFIQKVRIGSPAYRGGMRVADVIVQADGESIARVEELHQLLLRHKAGDNISVRIARNAGSKQTYKNLTITL